MKHQKLQFNNRIIILLMTIIFVMGNFFCFSFFGPVRAETSKYTSIVEDFANDPEFKPDEFEKLNWDEINIVNDSLTQIAESSDNELFIYVSEKYFKDPSKRFTKIRLSSSIGENARWADYDLELIDTYYSMHKYVVKNFTVLPDALRYYDIPCIFRPYDETVDGKLEGNNTGTSKAIDIGQLWTASTVNGTVSYTVQETDSIVVTEQYVGQLYYGEYGMLFAKGTLSFYIAFDTDISMDKIYEADISFGIIFKRLADGAVQEVVPYRTDTITADSTGSGSSGWYWWSKKHTWNNIQSKDDFVASENLDEATEELLKTKKWIIRFYALNTERNDLISKPVAGDYKPTDTTILRLNYVKDGKTYNVGVVSNRQTGSGKIDNTTEDTSFGDWWQGVKNWFSKYWYWLVIGVVALFALIVLSPFLPMILSGIVNLFVLLFKGLWWLISAPVRLIISLIKKDE